MGPVVQELKVRMGKRNDLGHRVTTTGKLLQGTCAWVLGTKQRTFLTGSPGLWPPRIILDLRGLFSPGEDENQASIREGHATGGRGSFLVTVGLAVCFGHWHVRRCAQAEVQE